MLSERDGLIEMMMQTAVALKAASPLRPKTVIQISSASYHRQ